jgi:phosphatidylglycerol:prolipoprotein diacylglycerol transferase
LPNSVQRTKVYDMQNHTWVDDLNPFLIQFSDTFGIRWYGLAYMTGFILGAWLMIFIARRGRRTLPEALVADFITYVVLGTMIGGRVGYVLFYAPDLLTNFSTKVTLFGIDFNHFWGALAVWEGGMASHGGIIGVLLATMLFARKHKLDWMNLGDLTVLGGALGIFCGRCANFINGELMGRPAPADLPWAVKFPLDIYKWADYEPSKLQSLAPVAETVGVQPAQWLIWAQTYSTNSAAYRGVRHTLDLIINRIQFQHDPKVIAAIEPLLLPRHPSQLYEALLEGLFLFAVCFWVWRKPRKPGVVGGIFLTLYAAVRIFGEQFRMPDAHIENQEFTHFGITRGQLLSFAMLLASAAVLLWVSRRKAEKIAGWGPEAQALRAADLTATTSGATGRTTVKTSSKKRGK